MLHIPDKGTAPVLIAVQGGEIQAAIVTSGEAVELHKQGRLQVLAVSGKERSALLPEVATMAQAVAQRWIGAKPPTLPRDRIPRTGEPQYESCCLCIATLVGLIV
ncbi:tripartite tricarboxylate transporter substrate-binding protein [Pseudomonas protegens]|uniref:tripartite tricarboxylate transporter substrate-binding protein n=1 Tax=Pseudomonas protegens TaxID=380021 RepID=UPI00283AB495|nr:tripartite tricarboxylate transporter substrate-binding protein [Pseudomonas protegens]